MSQYEGFPPASQESAIEETILLPDGTLNENFLREQYGLGAEEAMQTVNFGSYSGTVAQMLGDERCPVGGMVKAAYREKGLEGVEGTFKSLGALDPNFKPIISESTIQRERQKKN